MNSMISILIENETVLIRKGEEIIKEHKTEALPDSFISWQVSERMRIFKQLESNLKPTFLAPHLPTLITYDSSEGVSFPVNAACKGIGLAPKNKDIDTIVEELSGAYKSIKSNRIEETIQDRVKIASMFYSKHDIIDKKSLGGIEIFQSKSYKNIMQNPYVSLFFIGGIPGYKSYQINCVAEITESGHPFDDFIRLMRGLFEDAKFHYQQPVYPYVIKYHVVQVLEKTLKVRHRPNEHNRV